MLYDNAMLAWCYVEAYRQTSESRYAEVARGILDFVLREMTSPGGAFYTAFDAEVDAREGDPYLWTKEQIEAELKDFPALPGEPLSPADLFNRAYGVDRGPNFSDPHHGSGTADKNILFLPQPIGAVWSDLTLDPADLASRLAAMRERLYAVRKTRKQPLLDTKILTSWNALMIRAFAHAGKVLGEQKYLDAASRAAEFLLQNHLTSDGALLRTSGGGLTASEDASSAGGRARSLDFSTITPFFVRRCSRWMRRAFPVILNRRPKNWPVSAWNVLRTRTSADFTSPIATPPI